MARYLGAADANHDGILDDLQPAGTPIGAFRDASVTPETTGSIIDTGGLAVSVSDSPMPEGVQVSVGPGVGSVTLSTCAGGIPVVVPAGSTAVVTCGSVKVRVVIGSARIVLGGGVTIVTVPEGVTGYIDSNPDGSYLVKNLNTDGSLSLTVTVDGVSATVAPDTQLSVQTWQFIGFSQPVDNNGVRNVAKAGRVVPLKWRVLNAANQPVTNLSTANLSAVTTNCTQGVSTDAVEEYAAGASVLQNLGNGYYQFNWKTPSTYANLCSTLNLDIGDGVKHSALFKFTK